MHDDRAVVEARIERELWQRLLPSMYPHRVPFTVEAWDAPGEPVPYAEAAAQAYRPFVVGTGAASQWSRPWGTTWFRLTADVPDDWAGPQLEAVVDLGFSRNGAGFQAEGLVWAADGDTSEMGQPVQGIHPRRTGVPLPGVGAGPLTLLVEAASNPSFPAFRPSPLGSLATAGEAPLYRFKQADLALRDQGVYELLLDFEVLFGLMRALPADEPRRARLLRDLEATLDRIDMSDVPESAGAARARLRPALELRGRTSSLRVVGTGHAHIDSAWLWPVRETIRKCARTFASAVRLMDDEPDYVFSCSQAAQYDWMERLYPELFARISDKVAAGRFVPVGGMWVEADMNLPSGESIVRQIVHGQRYFESRFGIRCEEVWIPDVFGYPASLPQIFAAGGCSRFVTQKLSWNKQNRFPHNTFEWEGLDGTRVLTHFPPVDTYNAEVQPGEMRFSETNFRDAGWSQWALMPYGYGNGGGGPTREMLGRAKRMADLDGTPRLTLGTAADFFDAVEEEIADGARVPVWRGELYFEMHRGTLTSQTRTKVGNRRCERLFREAELVWAHLGALTSDLGDEVDRLWKDVLLEQFHDIIPGSSIAWVHADAEATHARVAARLEELIDESLAALSGGRRVVLNASTHSRREVVSIDGVPTMVAVPGSAVVALHAAHPVATSDHPVVTTEQTMSNGLVCVRWDPDGTITSIIDINRARELLPVGRPVTIELAPDHPVEYDAWDLESWTRGLGQPIRGGDAVLVESGPLRAAVQVTRRVGTSTIVQTVTLRAGSARIDIELDVDWQEDEQLLSMMVPLDVHTESATCDIQFGNVRRPTHPSSPWDAAKFEVCAHRYVDVSEPSFGVAVLNDGRYGHSLFDGGIRVSLLRAARYPDPDADRGRHCVTLAILPHGPGLHDVLAEAEALNLPLRVTAGDPGEGDVPAQGLVTLDHPGVQLSAVKLADDGASGGDGDVVLRLYEALGDRSRVTISTPRRITNAVSCNLLEELNPTSARIIEALDGIVTLTMRPYELLTLRLTLD